jgi:hypothetical protein
MPDRFCQNCKHFETSPIANKGWCRNPELYSPQQSQLFDQFSLGCARHYGNFWEPAESSGGSNTGTEWGTAPSSSRSRLRLFLPPPQLIPVAAGTLASSTGGMGNMGDSGPDNRETRGGRGSSGGSSSVPPSGSRGTRTGMPQGQERTVSYQPEERYWTDYLRIALPVVGLLLMLGLFWYWASAVIGDDDENQPTPRPTNEVAVITEPVPTNTTQPQVELNPQTITPEPTPRPTDDPNTTEDDATEEATEPPDEENSPGKGFSAGDSVVVASEANLRADGSLEAEVIDQLPEGTELEVISEAVESGGYFWLEVRVTETDQEGYIADEFIEATE